MTNAEAKKFLAAKLECLERDVSGRYEECNNRECMECDLNYEKGNMGEQKEALRVAIKSLEPKTGHWIDVFGGCECSECGYLEAGYSDYCPNCGAKMVEPQESEGKK